MRKKVLSIIITTVLLAVNLFGCSNVQSVTSDVPSPTTEAENTQADAFIEGGNFDRFMNELVSEDAFSGVVLVAKDGQAIFEKAYGMANKEAETPNDVETKFNLGSVNKMFTAVATAQLAEQGALNFDDTIGKYLDVFPSEIGDKITIEQLLTHTSGMGDLNTDYFTNADTIDSVDGFMEYVINQPLNFEPGTRHEYSNAGYVVLGAIIENVSGENYYDYIQEHIMKPCDMNNTDFYKKNADTPNLAHGYKSSNSGSGLHTLQPDDNGEELPSLPEGGGQLHTLQPEGSDSSSEWVDNIDDLSLIGNPSGGGYSTVKDMKKFADALMGYKLLSKEYTDLLITGKVETSLGQYAYGFEDLSENGYRAVGHSGGSAGINTMFRMLPDDGYTIVILSNYEEGVRAPYKEIIRLLTLS